MKRPAQTVCGILVLFLAFLTVSTGQAKIISQVPDTQQPVTGSIGNPVNNACAPVSAVNITQFWDVVRAHPNAFHVNAALIPNTAADYLYYFMDTNNWGSPVRMNGTVYPASSGTYSSDIMPGMHDFVRWDVLNPFTTPPPALPANKVGYDWTYNADFSDLGNIGFNFHTAAIDTGRPDIICFRYWNPVNSGTFVIDPTTGDTIRFFTWGPQVSGSTPPNPIEQWNLYYGQECVGHAVTGVGYYRNYDPDGGGPLPNTNWFICHDNWSTTPKNVALPWANWAATITADPGIVQIPVISVVPDSIFHSQLINTTVTYNNDFSISNTGTGALTYTATNVLPWVTFAGISGNIPAGGSDAINVTVNTTARPTGIYYDTLTILSNDPINPVIHIPEIFIQVTLPQIEPCTFYKAPYTDYSPNGMPDFDQKQGGWWNPGSGNFSWCGPVALANCIWWFDSKFEPNPIDPRPFFPGGNPPPNDNYGLLHSFGIWDDHDTNNVVPFISTLGPMCGVDVGGAGTALPNLQMGFISWMASVGMGGAYNANIVMGPGYPEIRDSVFSSQDVILLLGFYEILPSQDCQRLGGHYVTCAGACAQEPYLCISDPFFDKNEGEPPPGTAHGSTIHNDAFFVSGPHGTINHDRFHMAMIGTPTPCGPGLWGLTDYPNRWTQDGLFTFANENAISPGQPMGVYQGGQIVVMVDAALIICPIPMIPDINVLPDTLFYQQYSHTAQTYINQIIICNNGTAPLNISSITSDHGWITAGSFLSPLAAGQCDTIDITINAVGVVPGIYTGHFHVASDDPDTPVLNKPSYTVRIIEPDITVTLDSVFHAQLFNSVVVYPNDFSIASTGSAPLNYNLINTLPWVAYFGLTGLIPPGGVDHITTRVNTAGIAPGIYIDNITINSDDPDTPVLHKPKMVIQVVAPDIAVLPDSIYHSQPINNLVTYNADFMVRNNGTSILHYNMVSPLTWVTLAGGLGFIPPGGQDLINVTVNTNGVSVGTYTDIITINSDDPDTPILNKPKIVINVIPAEILPCDFYKAPYPDYAPNGMPDFDQKQGGWWNPGSGNFSWCGPVALANCIWWFDSKFEPNPVDPRPFFPGGNPPPNDNDGLLHSFGIWDDHDTNNVVPFISTLGPMCAVDGPTPGTLLPNMQMGFNSWLTSVGMSGAYTSMIVMGPGYPQLRDSIFSSQDVILLLGFYETTQDQQCVRLGGHYVTSAGACTQEPAICISDPFFDYNEGEPPPGTIHGSTIHNDAFFVSGPHGSINHDRYQMMPIPLPCPGTPATWMLNGYPNRWSQDGIFTFLNENPIQPGPPVAYQGGPIMVLIDAALIICPAQQQLIPDINVVPETLLYSLNYNVIAGYADQIIIKNVGTGPLHPTSITSDHSWVTVGSFLTTLAPGQADSVDITLNTTGLAVGIYTGHFHVASDDPDTPVMNKPFYSIEVTAPQGCDYVVGDANNSNTFTGLDVTYSVRYFKGGPHPPYSCACPPHGTWYVAGDVNGSCSFTGLDVTYMVRYFKGGPGPIPCPDCPPIDRLLGNQPLERKVENIR